MNQLEQIRLREWLRQGWILERRAKRVNAADSHGRRFTGDFLIGGGPLAGLDLDGLERASCAVWAPDFFSDFSTPFSVSPHVSLTSPFQTEWACAIGREELLNWLSGSIEKKVSEKNEISVPSAKVSWQVPSEKKFDEAFGRIGRAFREEGVKKAVPVVFSRGQVAMSDRLAWICDRIRAGVGATAENDLRLFGSWGEEGGFVGATPEDLFTRESDTVTSMAVAGTRALASLGTLAGDLEAEQKLVSDFLADRKERDEHDVVVADIESVLGQSDRSETRVQRFGALFHLVTDLTKNFSKSASNSSHKPPSTASLVSAFHPTPALGVAPRDPSYRLLKELHEICGEGVDRKNFGAPFVVKFESEVHAVVAIRQIRWTFDESDRAEIVVGSGCGIVPESTSEREWSELAAKRQAVMRMFRLSSEISEPVFWSLEVLKSLCRLGVRRFIVCAGARNAPLVVAAEALKGLVAVESFFEERSAAFYGLGLARSLGEPVAILTTSGTAVSELLPAMTEADFSGVPLVAVTADRPRRLRFSGAPQTIPQTRIFESVAEKIWDLEEGDRLDQLESLSMIRPLHVNVCLEEPLLADAERDPERLVASARQGVQGARGTDSSSPLISSLTKQSAIESEAGEENIALAALGDFLSRHEAKAAIVGGLCENERDAVAEFLVAHHIPSLLEGPSGLRGDPRLRAIELRGGDRDLQRFCLEGKIAGVIRIGGVPTTRVWRDLDDVRVKTQTLSISRLRFSGLGRGGFIHLPEVGALSRFLRRAFRGAASPSRLFEPLMAADRISAEKTEVGLRENPLSEAAFVRELSMIVPDDAIVYVGNSLPIRWWDQVATRERSRVVEANRGVNGIDGQLSTALGLAAGAGQDIWVLLGDLTALYDLAAPWALSRELSKMANGPKVRIVVLNNSGGRIFGRVLANAPGGAAPFENAHRFGFEGWAQLWQLDYAKTSEANQLAKIHSSLGRNAVIEVVPDPDHTAGFWKNEMKGAP